MAGSPPALDEIGLAGGIDRSIPFVDAHHHIWNLDRLTYAWLAHTQTSDENEVLGNYKAIRVNWGIDRLLKDFYGQNVIKSVHVEAGYSGPDPVTETRWLQSISDASGFPHAFVVACDLTAEDAEEQLGRHAEYASARGVRARPQPNENNMAAFTRGYAALSRYNFSYEVSASPGRLLLCQRLASEYPTTLQILGHAGFPLLRSPQYFAKWQSEVSLLAEAENIVCKISGLGMADHDWSFEAIRPWILHCIDAFGVDRCMFGSNWPVDSLYGSYFRQIDAFRYTISSAGLTFDEQERLLHRNAERYYRI